MIRLSIIGNSHVGPYKRAWEIVRDRWPEIEIDFFAAPGENFHKLALSEQRHLAPSAAHATDAGLHRMLERINGRTAIDLGAADYVLWVGYGHDPGITSFEPVVDLIAAFKVDDRGTCATGSGAECEGDVPAPGKLMTPPMSQPAFHAISAALAKRLLPGREWRGWPPGRLLFSPIHRPADAVLSLESALGKRWRRFVRTSQAGRRGLDLYTDALAAQLAAIGITMFRQPEATLGQYGLTRGELTRDSLYFSGRPHPENDVYHMNVDFGLICLDALFSRLDLPAGSPGSALTPQEPTTGVGVLPGLGCLGEAVAATVAFRWYDDGSQ